MVKMIHLVMYILQQKMFKKETGKNSKKTYINLEIHKEVTL